MTHIEHERTFIRRLNEVRKYLKARHVDGVEAVEPDGTVVFYLTERVLTTAGPGTKELRVERPCCSRCHEPWKQHAPPGGKCLFQSTEYDHD